MIKISKGFYFGIIFFSLNLPSVFAQQSLTSINSSIIVDFNSMGTTSSATLPIGWRVGNSSDWSVGTATTTQSAGNTGAGSLHGTSTGGCYNFGEGVNASSNERALGFLNSGSFTSPRSIMYAFTNNTGFTINQINISWNYEKYRSGSRMWDWTFYHGNTSTTINQNVNGSLNYPADGANTTIYYPALSTPKYVELTGLNIAPGTIYYLRWTLTGNGGSSNGQGLAIDDIELLPLYTNICSGSNMQITPSNSPSGWNSQNASIATTTVSGLVTAQNSGNVTVTYNSGGTTKNVYLNVVSSPSVSAGSNQTVCAGTSVTLTGSGATSYTWNNGVSNGVAFTPNATQTYTVTGTGANGCTGTAQTTVTVNAAPTVTANASTNTVCSGSSVTLTGSGATSYTWNNGVSNGVAFTPNATQTYTVTGTGANGCTGTAQTTVTVNALPIVNAGVDIVGVSTCGKDTVFLNASPLQAGQQGTWTILSGQNGLVALNTPNSNFQGDYGTSYTLQWTLTQNGCTASDQVNVTFNQPNTAALGAQIGTGDLLWAGLTSNDWSTASNWYQKQSTGYYTRMSGIVQPSINDGVFTLNPANGGICIGALTPNLSVNSYSEDVFVGSGCTLNLSGNVLNIAQNLVNNGTIVASTGTVNFINNLNSTISGSGNTQLYNMTVNKSQGATLTLQQPVLVTNTLTMTQGNVFTTNANLLTLGTSSAAPGALSYNTGTIVGPFKRYFANAATNGSAGLFPVGTATYNRYASFGFGTGPGVDQHLTVEYVPGAPMQGGVALYNGLPLNASGALIQNYSADGYWSVVPTNSNYTSPIASTNYSVTLFANNLNGMLTPQICRIIKSAGSNNVQQHHVAWQACGTHTPINQGVSPQSFAITSTAVQGFSWFNVGTSNNQILPVELMSFNGNCENEEVKLTWQTASEHNSAYFEVEKSRDGMDWQVLTTVTAAGNSTQLLNYEATDAHAMEGNNYYRLTQVDIDGAEKTYNVISVNCSGTSKGYFTVYPNPSTGAFQVVLNDKKLVGTGVLSVKDTKGAELLHRSIEVKPGINMFNVSELNLAPGVYYIQVVNGERATEVLKEVIR